MPAGAVVVVSIVRMGGSVVMSVVGAWRWREGGGFLLLWGWKVWVAEGFRRCAYGAWEFLGWVIAGSGVEWVEEGVFCDLGVEGPSPITKFGGTMGILYPYGSVFCGLSCNDVS